MSCLIQATSDDLCVLQSRVHWLSLNHIGRSIPQISCQGEPVHAYLYYFVSEKSHSSEVPKEGNSILSLIKVKEITFFDLSIIQLIFFEPLVSSTSFRK